MRNRANTVLALAGLLWVGTATAGCLPPGISVVSTTSTTTSSSSSGTSPSGGGVPPSISGVSPAYGFETGGTQITITGSGFTHVASCTIGGAPVQLISSTGSNIVALTGPGPVGLQTVRATFTAGGSASRASAFEYLAVPTVSGFSPSSGPTAGGTQVTITGTGLDASAQVDIGGMPASVVSASATQLVVLTGASTVVGTQPLTVVRNYPGAGGLQSIAAAPSGFTYVGPAPTLSSIAPNSGGGGVTVTLTGANFFTGATVVIGGVPAAVQTVSASQIVAVTGSGSAGSFAVTVTNTDGQSAMLPGAFQRDGAPTVSVAGPPREAVVGDDVAFSVTATDPEGGLVSLRLLNPPPGCVTLPVSGGSPATLTVRWHVRPVSGGDAWLQFEARDGAPGRNATLAPVRVRVIGTGVLGTPAGAPNRVPWIVADVTGDGVDDVIAGARGADSPTAVGAGLIHVWAGRANPAGLPSVTLHDPQAAVGDRCGDASGQGLFAADVTGDGVADVIALVPGADVGGVADAGAVLVWPGGSALTSGPTPTPWRLTVSGAQAGDQLGWVTGRGLRLADVTGDGQVDLIVGAALADRGGVTDAGVVYVWAGGSTLASGVSPTATLHDPNATAGRRIGGHAGTIAAGSQDALWLADLTGDGQLDVVAGSAGDRVYVWAGGTACSGTCAPTAIATVTTGPGGPSLGNASGQGACAADVNGDGVADLIVADRNAAGGAGAVYLWLGGSGFQGTRSPSATLAVSGAASGDALGQAPGEALQVADVTGDGRLDIIVAAEQVVAASPLATGAIYVWAGRLSWSGTVAPSATCRVAGSGFRLVDCTGQAVQIADVTGDGIGDLLVGARQSGALATAGGAVYVWAGGASLSGTPAPTAALASPDAGAQLTACDGTGFDVADLDGDRVLDLVAGAPYAASGGVPQAGAVCAWYGHAGLAGTIAPDLTLVVAGAFPNDRVGLTGGQGRGFLFADIDGSGTPDIIGTAADADGAAATDAGAVYVWFTSPGLRGTYAAAARCGLATPTAQDRLGAGAGQGVLCDDVTGDGQPDLLVASTSAMVNGLPGAGLVAVWDTPALLGGGGVPSATILLPGGGANDAFGACAGTGLRVAETTGDTVLDVWVGAAFADRRGVADAGALVFAAGNGGLTGGLTAGVACEPSTASNGSYLPD